ncbi:MAG: hypothetical protein K0R14_896 [Burkholderiales bacterium]|jgi:hypothetical protein|nr:hypothetical protein [Burkholderiales bacterium]
MKVNFKSMLLILGSIVSTSSFAGTAWHFLLENHTNSTMIVSPNNYEDKENGSTAWGKAKCFNRPDGPNGLGGVNGKYVHVKPEYEGPESSSFRLDVTEINEGRDVLSNYNCAFEDSLLNRYMSKSFDFFINSVPVELKSFYSPPLLGDGERSIKFGSFDPKIMQTGDIKGDDDLPFIVLKYYGSDKPLQIEWIKTSISSKYMGEGIWHVKVEGSDDNLSNYKCEFNDWGVVNTKPTCTLSSDKSYFLVTVPNYARPELLRGHVIKLIHNVRKEFNSKLTITIP